MPRAAHRSARRAPNLRSATPPDKHLGPSTAPAGPGAGSRARRAQEGAGGDGCGLCPQDMGSEPDPGHSSGHLPVGPAALGPDEDRGVMRPHRCSSPVGHRCPGGLAAATPGRSRRGPPGSHGRWHWAAADRATCRIRATALVAFASSHRTTDRSARNGTTRSMPSSVSFCTTRSGLSPLTSANPTVSTGSGRGCRLDRTGELQRLAEARRPPAAAARRPPSADRRPAGAVPAAGGGAHRPRAPERRGRPTKVSGPGWSAGCTGLPERRLDPRQQPGLSGSDLVAALGGVGPQRFLLLVGEVGRDLDLDPHDQVAALATFEVRHTEAAEAGSPCPSACPARRRSPRRRRGCRARWSPPAPPGRR